MTLPPNQPPPFAQPGDIFAAQNKPLNPMATQKIRITPGLLFFERGGLRTNAQQIPMAHLNDIDATQSMTQKARGVGSVRVLVARQQGFESVILDDFAEFRLIVDILNDVSRRARIAEQQMRNTQNVNYGGMAPGVPPMQPQRAVTEPAQNAPMAPAADPFEQLERLGKLRDTGVISEEEFATKKAEWLSRM